MFKWLAQRRVNAIDVQLAGLRAKLKATKETVDMVAPGSDVPGSLVCDLQDLPLGIAELEERKRQLLEKRVSV